MELDPFEVAVVLLTIAVGSIGFYAYRTNIELNGSRLSYYYQGQQAHQQEQSYKNQLYQANETIGSDNEQITSLTDKYRIASDNAAFDEESNGFLQDEVGSTQTQLFQDQSDGGY